MPLVDCLINILSSFLECKNPTSKPGWGKNTAAACLSQSIRHAAGPSAARLSEWIAARAAHWTTKENSETNTYVFACVWSMDKIVCNGTKWGQEVCFHTNESLANILGDIGFDFDNSYVWVCFS